MTPAPRFFIPVCLYPHTQYRTTAGVAALFETYGLRHHDYLIVIADRLLVLDRLVTGRYWTVNSAVIAARREAQQIAKLIKRISHKSEAQARGRIVFWDEIAETAEFVAFASRLQKDVLADDMLAAAIEQFVSGRVDRFGLGAAPDRERGYEREYLLSEACMSVYCTEMLRYCTEVWERPPARDVPDPLKLLYDERKELIERVIGRAAMRVLVFLNADVHFPALSGAEMIGPD
ncbi:MAG: hypothetical protein ACXW3T_11675 [Rhodoplanes sp.]|jgi:hypothetical protein